MRLIAFIAIVLLVHAVALEWLASRFQQPDVLRPLVTPMFTRLLKPQAPAAPPPAQATAPAKPRPQRGAISSVAKPSTASEPASIPSPAASAPPEPQVAEPSLPQPTETVASSQPQTATPTAILTAQPGTDLDSWPADTRLSFRMGGQYRGNELHGSAWVQWQREQSRYQTRVDIDVFLLTSLVLTSQGEVTAQGLAPKAYEELRGSGPRGAKLGEETILLANGRTVPRPPRVQDTASQFVELSHRFASGEEKLEVGRSVSFWMARPGAVDFWTYDIVEREMLQSPELGTFEAFHLKPRPIANPRGNITAEMWFAPSLQYLPVRIRVNMGEATYVDLMVVKIEQR